MKVGTWPKTRAEMRTGVIFSIFWGGLGTVLFVLPLMLSDSVTVTSDIGLLGEQKTKTGPGSQFIVPLLFLAFGFFAIAFFVGVAVRRNRQLILLGASNPNAPLHLRNQKQGGVLDRRVYCLSQDGTDA